MIEFLHPDGKVCGHKRCKRRTQAVLTCDACRKQKLTVPAMYARFDGEKAGWTLDDVDGWTCHKCRRKPAPQKEAGPILTQGELW